MGEKIIGILGGMGPEATADLFLRIIKATRVERDQDHPRTIVYSNSKVPDRTAAVLGEGESPVPEMLRAARGLERAGAEFLIIPCNTAHNFIDEVREQVGVPILNMIELAATSAGSQHKGLSKAGLIATDGTLKSGIYERFFEQQGVRILAPSQGQQALVMEAIYRHIKTGDLDGGRRMLLEVSGHLIEGGAQLVVCGCTEVSLVLKDGDLPVPVLDPVQNLAETAVKFALGKL